MNTAALLLFLLFESALAQLGSISGVVRNAAGEPMAGVRVALTDASSGSTDVSELTNLVRTDETGNYRIEAVPPGRYYVVAGRIQAPTFYPGTGDIAKAESISITPNTAATLMDFVMPERKSIVDDRTTIAAKMAGLEMALIRRLEIRGNRITPQTTIRAKLSTRPGNPIDLDTLLSDLTIMDATWHFEEIGVSLERELDGVVVVFQLKELPLQRTP